MDIVGIQNAVYTTLQTGMAGVVNEFYAQHPDSISNTPAMVMGQPKLSVTLGQRQDTDCLMPLRFYVGRVADNARAAIIVNNLVNAFIVAMNPIASYTNLWRVITRIDIDTDRYYEVARTQYHAIDVVLHMELIETGNWTST